MDGPASLVPTKKVRRFVIPPEALTDAQRAARHDDAPRLMRISAVLAVLTLVAIALLIAEPWETLRPWLLRP